MNRDENLIQQWFIRRNITSGTQKAYRISLNRYLNLIGKSLFELIEEAEKEEDLVIRPRKRKVNNYLLKYKKYLEEDNIAPSTLSLYLSAVKSLYKSYDITLIDIKLNRGDIGLDKNLGKTLNRKDILRLVSVASPREKALIYLMALSGMGQQEARDLTIRKLLNSASSAIEKDLDDVYDLFKFEDDILKKILTLEITRKKIKYKHHTFIPPEAAREIIIYLKERCYGPNKKIRIKDNNDNVFVANYGGELTRDSIVTNFRRIGQIAGLKREKGTYSYWRSHALRKYFITTIINKIGDKTIADYMAGHKINDQDRTYWRADPEDLKKQYLKALPFLSLDKAKVRDVTSKEFEEFVRESRSKDKKIEEMMKKMEEMEKKMEEE
jgi:integrase